MGWTIQLDLNTSLYYGVLNSTLSLSMFLTTGSQTNRFSKTC